MAVPIIVNRKVKELIFWSLLALFPKHGVQWGRLLLVSEVSVNEDVETIISEMMHGIKGLFPFYIMKPTIEWLAVSSLSRSTPHFSYIYPAISAYPGLASNSVRSFMPNPFRVA